MEKLTVEFIDPMLYDRLNILSAEYNQPVNLLINFAVKHLLDDVSFLRELRTGNAKSK